MQLYVHATLLRNFFLFAMAITNTLYNRNSSYISVWYLKVIIKFGICVAMLVIRASEMTTRNGARALQFSSQNPLLALPLGEVLHVQFSNLGSYKMITQYIVPMYQVLPLVNYMETPCKYQ